MRLFKHTKYNFIGLGRPMLVLSTLLMVGSVILLFARGPNFGIDFTGGVKVDVLANRGVTVKDLEYIRSKLPVEIHSIGRDERELLIQQKGMERAEDYAAAIVEGRKKAGKFKTLAEVAALPGVELTEEDLATVFSVKTEDAASAKGTNLVNINLASPDNIRERMQRILADKTVAHMRVVLGEVFGVPANTAGKIDLNAIDDPQVLADTLKSNLPSTDAAALAANISLKRRLGTTASATGLLPSLDDALAGAKVSPAGVAALRSKFYASSYVIRGSENIGPRVSKELIGLALKALAFALLAMLVYIGFRFKVASGVVAVISLIHDVLITLGLVVLFQFEIDLTVVAAFMTVVGYSINDTVVTYDRIREDTRQGRKESYKELLNRAINENLSRTLITGTGTLIALLVLFFLGGEPLKAFSFVLWIGIILGTYSSVYICAALLVEFDRFKSRNRGRQVEAKTVKAKVHVKKKKR